MSVNGQSLVGLTRQEVTNILKDSADVVNLVVLRGTCTY